MAGLPQRFAELHNTLAQRNGGRVPDKDLQQLRRLAHTLAGSAETFGLMKLGASARALEAVVVDGVDDPQHRAALIDECERADRTPPRCT